MIKQLLILDIKSFFRSASVGKSIAIQILLGFLAVYFALSFIGLGLILFEILHTNYPKIKPFQKVQDFVGIWIVYEVFIRFFMQTLPVLNIKSFLLHNIKKSSLVHFILIKSLFSYYNLIALFIAIPFTIIAVSNKNITSQQGLVWIISIFFIQLIINYANFLIKKSFTNHFKIFIPIAILVFVLIALEYFQIFSTSAIVADFMLYMLDNPLILIVLAVAIALVYYLNFVYLKNNFYLDTLTKNKTNNATTTDLGWTKRFGDIAPFLELDLKLIWRNKRPKATILMSFVFLGYGLIFYPNPSYQETPTFFVFVGIFITGIFIINFGQFIPSWDSGYFSFLHSQNTSFHNYLQSKAFLLSISGVLLGLLSIPYIYFGWNIFWINLSCALYNIGVNVLVILYAGAFNKKKIDLEKSPFMNYQGTGAAQWIVGFPLLLIPMLLWYLFYKLINQETANLILAALGIIALALRPYFMKIIVQKYQSKKYETLNGFKQQEN